MPGKQFSNYYEYVSVAGFNIQEFSAFKELIDRFYEKKKTLFRSQNCASVPYQAKTLNSLYDSDCSKLFSEFEGKRYVRKHFFLAANLLSSNETLIVDPTGVPKELTLRPDISSITPYFGLVSKAPKSHLKVYSNMEDMDSAGTSEFPVGFRP